MCWVVSFIIVSVLVLQILKWFFMEVLPWIFRHIGTFIDWSKDVISGLCSWSVSAWKGLRGWIAARSSGVTEGGQVADQSLLDSSAASDISKEANLSQPPKPMWPFGSKDIQPGASSQQTSKPARPVPPPVSPVNQSNPQHELTKTKADLFRAQNQLKSLEDTIKGLEHDADTLTRILREKEIQSKELLVKQDALEHKLCDAYAELSSLQKRYEDVSSELEKLKPFAAVKSDERRMTYSVSPELHKKWQSIMRETKRLQVLELLGQPSEILAVSLTGAAPIQLIRKGVPAPRPELMQHVTNLVLGDNLLMDWVRGVGRTAWVYADDTLAPGVIFFASESDGGQVFRIFPPEC